MLVFRARNAAIVAAVAVAAATGLAFAQMNSSASCTGALLAAPCATCHGSDAGSAIPNLHMMDRDAIATAMRDFASGERESTVMYRLAPAYEDDEITAIADYYAQGGCQ